MAHETHFETRSQAQYEYDRAKAEQHMRKQVTQFAIMLLLTFTAFAAVIADFKTNFVVPIILLLAGVQVAQQLYAFMHLEEKDTPHNGIVQFFLWSAVTILIPVFLAMLTIIWW